MAACKLCAVYMWLSMRLFLACGLAPKNSLITVKRCSPFSKHTNILGHTYSCTCVNVWVWLCLCILISFLNYLSHLPSLLHTTLFTFFLAISSSLSISFSSEATNEMSFINLHLCWLSRKYNPFQEYIIFKWICSQSVCKFHWGFQVVHVQRQAGMNRADLQNANVPKRATSKAHSEGNEGVIG